jgi:hypothetical protein
MVVAPVLSATQIEPETSVESYCVRALDLLARERGMAFEQLAVAAFPYRP